MKLFFLPLILVLSLPLNSFSFDTIIDYDQTNSIFQIDQQLNKPNPLDSLTIKEFRRMKITAVTLAVTLGVFGVHRLYLGTSARIPITYTLTLGGGFFVLPAIDIVYILISKHPEQIRNNNSIFIWNKSTKDNP